MVRISWFMIKVCNGLVGWDIVQNLREKGKGKLLKILKVEKF